MVADLNWVSLILAFFLAGHSFMSLRTGFASFQHTAIPRSATPIAYWAIVLACAAMAVGLLVAFWG